MQQSPVYNWHAYLPTNTDQALDFLKYSQKQTAKTLIEADAAITWPAIGLVS